MSSLETFKYREMIEWLDRERVAFQPPQVMPGLTAARDSFEANVREIYLLAGFGLQLVQHSHYMQQLADMAMMNVFGSLIHEGSPTIDEIQDDQKLRAEMHRLNTPENLKKRSGPAQSPSSGATNVDVHASENPQIGMGLQAMMRAMLTSTWTAFEALAGDLWKDAINTHPSCLAELSGAKKRITELAGSTKMGSDKIAGSNPDGDGKQVLLSDINRITSGTFDMSQKWGSLLKGSFNFSTLGGIREAYSKAFSTKSDAADACLSDKCLNSLSAVRNLIIHKAGIADEEYQRNTKVSPLAPRLNVGERLQIDGKLTESLIQPVLRRCNELLLAVNCWPIAED